MRLGGALGVFNASQIEDLEPLCDVLDTYGLSAISGPDGMMEMTDDELFAYREKACELNLVIGETFYFANMIDPDEDVRAEHISKVRAMLTQAEKLGCKSVVTLVGTTDPGGFPTHPDATNGYLHSSAAADEFREIVLRILDGLDLPTVKYIIEPWNNTFFYEPETIRAFFDRVDHPMLGLHLDQMNMVSQATYYDTTSLINQTFDLLADKVVSVHLKDILQTRGPGDFVAFKEVLIGEGSMDYATYLRRLAELDPDVPCYCEHLPTEADYALNFARLHYIASKSDVSFLRRT